MHTEQWYIEDAIGALDEMGELFPLPESMPPDRRIRGEWVFIEAKDERISRFNELERRLVYDALQLKITIPEWFEISSLGTSGPRNGGPGWFLRVVPWKEAVRHLRDLFNNERPQQAVVATTNGPTSEIAILRNLERLGNELATALVELQSLFKTKTGSEPFEITINDVDRKMTRDGVNYRNRDAEFSQVRTSEPWKFATSLIRANGGCVDFSQLFRDQSGPNLRKIKQKVQEELRVLDIEIKSCGTSKWKAIDKSDQRDK